MPAIEDSDQIQIGLYDKVDELCIKWLNSKYRFYTKLLPWLNNVKEKVKIDIPKGFFVIRLRHTQKLYVKRKTLSVLINDAYDYAKFLFF